MRGNRLLPIVSGLVLLMVLFIGVRSCGKNRVDTTLLSGVPTAPSPDADSPADTIRTLTAEVAQIKSQNEAMKQQGLDILGQREELAREVAGKVRVELEKKAPDTRSCRRN